MLIRKIPECRPSHFMDEALLLKAEGKIEYRVCCIMLKQIKILQRTGLIPRNVL